VSSLNIGYRSGMPWLECRVCSFATGSAPLMQIHLLAHIHDRLVDLEEAILTKEPPWRSPAFLQWLRERHDRRGAP
jgi:hypothetical protein